MRRWIAGAAALALVAGSAVGAMRGDLSLAGSATLGAQLVPNLLATYGASRDSTPRTLVTTPGTGAGFTAMAEGRANLVMASRKATPDERVQVLRAGLGDPASPGNANVLALDSVAVLVNRDNGIGILTLDQIRRLFTGQITNWSSLGGRDLPVNLYSADPRSSVFDTFTALALGPDEMAAAATKLDTGRAVADAVATDPAAIGFAGLADIRSAKPVTIALACGMTIEPKPFNVRTEEYPLARRLYLYAPSEKSPLMQDFLQFALSAAAIVQRAGFVDLAPELGAPGDGLPRPGLWDPAEAKHRRDILTRITQSLAGARRLSTTFRFEPDGTLDARALADIGRIAAWKRDNPGRKLILVGYWSGLPSFDANLALSLRRAQSIATALTTAGTPPEQILPGSTLRPLACDDDPTNRRVEVWVR